MEPVNIKFSYISGTILAIAWAVLVMAIVRLIQEVEYNNYLAERGLRFLDIVEPAPIIETTAVDITPEAGETGNGADTGNEPEAFTEGRGSAAMD